MAKVGEMTVEVKIESRICEVDCTAMMCANNRVNLDGLMCNLKRVEVDEDGRCRQFRNDETRIIQTQRSR